MEYDNVDETTDDTTRRSLFECRVQVANIDMDLNDTCYYYTTDITDRRSPCMAASFDGAGSLSLCLVVADATGRIKTYSAKSLHRHHALTLMWAKKGSPQALGSAGRYPHTCHQATGMIGGKTRPRLLHVRYRRIPMYGSISTGTLPNHQRDPMEGDCLTKHSASWACKGGGAPNPAA